MALSVKWRARQDSNLRPADSKSLTLSFPTSSKVGSIRNSYSSTLQALSDFIHFLQILESFSHTDSHTEKSSHVQAACALSVVSGGEDVVIFLFIFVFTLPSEL